MKQRINLIMVTTTGLATTIGLLFLKTTLDVAFQRLQISYRLFSLSLFFTMSTTPLERIEMDDPISLGKLWTSVGSVLSSDSGILGLVEC